MEKSEAGTLKVGQLAIAVARVGEHGVNASLGMLGGLGGAWRTWRGGRIEHLIRVAITLYPGFSGGALLDAQGGVIGINTAGLARSGGIALPHSTVDRVADELLAKGYIARPHLGVAAQARRSASAVDAAAPTTHTSPRGGKQRLDQALAHIAERVALPATVLLASNDQPERQLLALGVRAVLLPDRLPAARLVAAVKAVAAGLIVFDEHAANIESPGEDERRREPGSVDALTARETEVLQLLAKGLPNKEIARALDISEHTVKFHLSAIFGKLGATSRTEAVAIGIRRGRVMI